MSIKNKKFTNIINTYLGIGDILFFVVIAAAFSPFNFIMFYLISTVLTLMGVGLLRTLKKDTKDIPLAGAMAGMLIILVVLSLYAPHYNFHDDGFFISYLAQ